MRIAIVVSLLTLSLGGLASAAPWQPNAHRQMNPMDAAAERLAVMKHFNDRAKGATTPTAEANNSLWRAAQGGRQLSTRTTTLNLALSSAHPGGYHPAVTGPQLRSTLPITFTVRETDKGHFVSAHAGGASGAETLTQLTYPPARTGLPSRAASPATNSWCTASTRAPLRVTNWTAEGDSPPSRRSHPRPGPCSKASHPARGRPSSPARRRGRARRRTSSRRTPSS
jgi:hypothetical protein